MFNFSMSQTASKTPGTVYSSDAAVKLRIEKQLRSIRSLLTNNRALTGPTIEPLTVAFEQIENEANIVLKSGDKLTAAEIRTINGKANFIELSIQGLLSRYNTALTGRYNFAKSINDDSYSYVADVFNDKAIILGLQSEDNLMNIAPAEKKTLEEWNAALTAQANKYFSETSAAQITANKDKLHTVFDRKKIVAKNLHLLKYSAEERGKVYFEPLDKAIDGLNDYLTNDVHGRFNNPSTFFSWWGGYSRTTKLNNTLTFCDTIVLNMEGDELPHRSGSLAQGNLYKAIGDFILPLNAFFDKVAGRITPENPDVTPSSSRSSSPSAPPRELDLSSATTAPVIVTREKSDVPNLTILKPAGFAQFINRILESSPAVTEPAKAQGSNRAEHRKNLIERIKKCNECKDTSSADLLSDLLDKLTLLICHSHCYEDGDAHLRQLYVSQSTFVTQVYGEKAPPSVTTFMAQLKGYSALKYRECYERPNPKQAELLSAAQACVKPLIEQKALEKTLGDYARNATDVDLRGIIDGFLKAFKTDNEAAAGTKASMKKISN